MSVNAVWRCGALDLQSHLNLLPPVRTVTGHATVLLAPATEDKFPNEIKTLTMKSNWQVLKMAHFLIFTCLCSLLFGCLIRQVSFLVLNH